MTSTSRTTWRTAIPAIAVLLALLALPAAGAPALHEEAVLESPSSAVPAGSPLALDGRDFTAGEAYTLRLEGTLREYDLRKVEPGEDGTFSLEVEIPAEVRPGSYQLVAVAPDGDVVARLDLAVLRGASGDPAAGDGDGGSEAGDRSGADAARSDEMELERDRGALEWGVIGLLVGLAGGFGVGLLRKGSAGRGA